MSESTYVRREFESLNTVGRYSYGRFPAAPGAQRYLVKDVLIVGFGAVGAVYSVILKRGELARVTTVARSNYDLLAAKGLEYRSQKYGFAMGWKPHRLCRTVLEAVDRQYDYVVLTTKAIPEVAKTSEILVPFLTRDYNQNYKQPTYVIMQNGLNVEVEFYEALKALNKGEPKIISTAVYIGANMVEPNLVIHNDFDRVFLGVYRHNDRSTLVNTPQELELITGFTKMIEMGGSTVQIVPEIQRVKYSKNFWNVAFSGMATLTAHTLPAMFRPPPSSTTETYSPYVCPDTADLIEAYTIPLIKGIFDELIILARALGFPDTEGNEGVPGDVGGKLLEGTKNLHMKPSSEHIPSMLLDLRKGLPLEIEVIIGEVVRMARGVNVDLPRVETLYGILVVIQNQILRKMKEKASESSS